MPRDYYEVLGVSRRTSDGEIKRAFRRLARELHPDVNKHDPDAEEKFKEAAEAYEVLSDPERRRTYDAFGHEGLRTGGWTPATDFGSFEDVLSAFFGRGDPLFSELFGFGRPGPASGGDLAARVEISLEDVLTGTTREVSFDAVSTCERCRGNGAEPGTPIRTCDRCGGSGQLRQVSRTVFGQMVRTGMCPACHGTGRRPEQPCRECRGEGRVVRERRWSVDIPPGIESGQRIRITGAGHAGEPGAATGDLYVEVVVSEDERFERVGRDLVSREEIPATRAMLGGTLTVETIDGEQEVDVPAGVQPGETVTIRGLGLPGLGRASRGDHHVVLDVVVPVELDAEQRGLVDQLDESLDEDNLRRAGRGRRWRLGSRRRARR
jgi:molecular chaperone DnaJ